MDREHFASPGHKDVPEVECYHSFRLSSRTWRRGRPFHPISSHGSQNVREERPIMNALPSQHVPVLLNEIIEWLVPRPGAVFVDGTLGGGGHTRALAELVVPGGQVIALDRDPAAVEAARDSLAGLPVQVVHANYADVTEVLAGLGIADVDGVILDLGLSSDQLADESRGFSFSAEGSLDLRFDPSRGEPAVRLVNRLSAERLADLIYMYGEERYSRRIARAIAQRRRHEPIQTAADLARLVRSVVPRSRTGHQIDPATRTFQALRIAVNDELKWLEVALRRTSHVLKTGGRMAVISFHSLEDRRVKEEFRNNSSYEPLTRRPIQATPEEIQRNTRSRSAKLRVAARTTK